MKLSRASAYGLHAVVYMVRHITQTPVTADTIAKAGGVPARYLAKILQRLARAGLLQAVRGRTRGYVFAKPPGEISLLELFETIEGQPLLDGCPLRHCECGGTPENCGIFARWVSAARGIEKVLEQTNIATVAWNCPEHRFDVAALGSSPCARGVRIERKQARKYGECQ